MIYRIIWQSAFSNMELHRPAGINAHVLKERGLDYSSCFIVGLDNAFLKCTKIYQARWTSEVHDPYVDTV